MAQVTTADIRTRIKDILENNADVSANVPYIFDVAPMALQRGNVPAIVIIEGNGTYQTGNLGERFVNPTLSITIALYMQEWTANSTVNINANGVDAVTTAIEDTFQLQNLLHYNDNGLKGIRSAKLTSVTGVAPRPYPSGGMPFVHKQWTLQVTYSRKV
jgi:hypothetical protein